MCIRSELFVRRKKLKETSNETVTGRSQNTLSGKKKGVKSLIDLPAEK